MKLFSATYVLGFDSHEVNKRMFFNQGVWQTSQFLHVFNLMKRFPVWFVLFLRDMAPSISISQEYSSSIMEVIGVNPTVCLNFFLQASHIAVAQTVTYRIMHSLIFIHKHHA